MHRWNGWRRVGSGLLLGLGLVAANGLAAAEKISPMESGLNHYAQENFEEALVDFLKVKEELTRPKPKRSGAIGLELLGLDNLPVSKDMAEVVRLLGLTYFQLNRYDEAAKELHSIIEQFKRDESILFALAEIELDSGNPRRALDHLQLLKQMVSYKPEVRLLEGHALAAMEQDYDAIQAWQAAMELSASARAMVTLPLAQAYVRTGRLDSASRLLTEEIERDPGNINSRRNQILLAQLKRVRKPLVTQIGMRLESDSNAAQESSKASVDTGLDAKSDTRTVLIGDLVYQQALNPHWVLYHEGHAYLSQHQQLSEFDEFRLQYTFSPGYSTNRWGMRFPLGITWNQLDGRDYLTKLSSTPGAYYRIHNDLSLLGYINAEISDYKDDGGTVDDRSGSYRGVGLYSLWYFKDRDGELRFKFDRGNNEADGNDWSRAETAILLDADYRFTPVIKAGAGFVNTRHDYGHLNSVYIKKRSDSAMQLSASIQYLARKEWEFQARYSTVAWDSNIDVYSYDRNVLMLSVVWRREARTND